MSEFLKGSGCPERLKKQGWNILNEEVSFPVAVIDKKAISLNAKWMADFANASNVNLAPHGKTTMSPELFKQQLEQGAWAITLATVPQVLTAIKHGIQRIILANQLVGKFHFELIANALKNQDIEFYCFVDSIENAESLGKFFTEHDAQLNLLLEIGVENGRCGWRDVNTIEQLVSICHQYQALNIAGLGFYEGVIGGDNAANAVNDFVHSIVNTAIQLHEKNVFGLQKPVITGAGSAWYDIVAKVFDEQRYSEQFTHVIRPGCYLIHDTGIYEHAQNQVEQRSQLACDISGRLESSLSLWAYVLSKPQTGMAIIGLGKRDVAFDAGLPTPEQTYNVSTQTLSKAPSDFKVTKIMDQHCMLECSAESFDSIKVGDLIRFSTSHPCLTFDKWKQLGVVESDNIISSTIKTYF